MNVTREVSALALVFSVASVVVADPSEMPIRRQDGHFDERYRARLDLNGDGRLDLILSRGVSEFGNSGGDAQVFLARENNKYQLIGEIPFSPRGLMAIEPTNTGTRVWTYGHKNAQSGVIGYNEIANNAVSSFHGLEINAGDGGSAIGNAVFAAVFATSPRPLIERSATTEGVVHWNLTK